MGNESRPDFMPHEEEDDGQQLNVLDPEALPEKNGLTAVPSEAGKPGNEDEAAPVPPKDDVKEEDLTDEQKQQQADEEERAKVMKRMAVIVDKGLDKVKPLLEMIDQTIEEAEKKKREWRT